MKALHVALTLTLGLWLGLAHAAPGAHGPNGEHLDGPSPVASTSGLARLPDGSVSVPKLAQRRMSIRTIVAPQSEAASTIELNGRVTMDPNAGGRVQAVHGGIVEAGPKGLPLAGQAVERGQVLAYLQHHAEPFAEANQQALLAELRAARKIAEQRLSRLESLEGTTPRKDVDTARAELEGLAARERSIGGSLRSREGLTAPVSGVIARADLVVGQVVEAGTVLFEVVDPARLVIEATTTDAGLAARIDDAALPGHTLTLVGAARVLRDGLLPLLFRVRTEPNAAPLAIGQPVTVIVRLKDKVSGVVLPASAVARNASNEPVVWIKVGAERFTPQPVELRALDAIQVVVTRGLAPDNRVVVQGAALVNQIR